MNLPVGIATVDVFGTLKTANGLPCIGSLEFTASVAVAYTVSDVTLLPETVEIFLDSNGYFIIRLPATNDPAANPMGWYYTVKEKMAGGRLRKIALPMLPATVDYADTVEIAPAGTIPQAPVATVVSIISINGGTP